MIDFIKQKISLGTLFTVLPFIAGIIIYISTMNSNIDKKLDRECFVKDSVQKSESLEYIKRGVDKIDKEFQDLRRELRRSNKENK